jgi:hypothetical protein
MPVFTAAAAFWVENVVVIGSNTAWFIQGALVLVRAAFNHDGCISDSRAPVHWQ